MKTNLSLHLIWSGQANSFTRTQLRAWCRHKNGKVEWVETGEAYREGRSTAQPGSTAWTNAHVITPWALLSMHAQQCDSELLRVWNLWRKTDGGRKKRYHMHINIAKKVNKLECPSASKMPSSFESHQVPTRIHPNNTGKTCPEIVGTDWTQPVNKYSKQRQRLKELSC